MAATAATALINACANHCFKTLLSITCEFHQALRQSLDHGFTPSRALKLPQLPQAPAHAANPRYEQSYAQ
jgi:hypothetical protein